MSSVTALYTDLQPKSGSSGSKRDPTPLDVIRRVARYLDDDQSYSTLAALSLSCKNAYHVLSPILYRDLVIRGPTSNTLIDLVTLDDGIEDLDAFISQSEAEGDFFGVYNPVRRLVAFRHVNSLTISSFPSEIQSRRLLDISTALDSAGSLLFPNLKTVRLMPDAVDEIRTYIPEDYDRPHNPPFLEAIVASSRPNHLCLSFPLTTSDKWEEARETTSSGAYKLVSRIHQLRSDGWSNLTSFDIHDIVYQVLPSLPGCRNTYHFSPHILYPDRYRNGKDGVHIPGPSWNFRAWQLSTSVKNLFPSGTDAQTALKGTSWHFVNLAGHVLKKVIRDDDDDTGVGYDEVDSLVRGAVKSALPQDLPMRDGFGVEQVDEVFDSIHYVEERKECECCKRRGWEDAKLSSLKCRY